MRADIFSALEDPLGIYGIFHESTSSVEVPLGNMVVRPVGIDRISIQGRAADVVEVRRPISSRLLHHSIGQGKRLSIPCRKRELGLRPVGKAPPSKLLLMAFTYTVFPAILAA